MGTKFPFSHLDPILFSGLLEDPVLVVRTNPSRSNLMVDCGQIEHIAKRVIKSIDLLFITHAHMDHFIGMDHFVRCVLVSNKTIKVFGPVNLAEKIHAKMKAYDWNLVEPYFCSLEVFEIGEERIDTYLINGADQFSISKSGSRLRETLTIFENDHIKVEAKQCDHKIPVLIYKFTEKPPYQIDETKLKDCGYKTGPWLEELKDWFHDSQSDETKSILAETCDSGPKRFSDLRKLYNDIKKDTESYSIGYVTDVGFTRKNREVINSLMENVSLLVCECTYLSENKSKARESYHLCTDDINKLVNDIKPSFLLPMHLSNSHLGNSAELYNQLKPGPKTKLLKIPERVKGNPITAADLFSNNTMS